MNEGRRKNQVDDLNVCVAQRMLLSEASEDFYHGVGCGYAVKFHPRYSCSIFHYVQALRGS
jgi:hypothetical protein